jgi:hypothetical protein
LIKKDRFLYIGVTPADASRFFARYPELRLVTRSVNLNTAACADPSPHSGRDIAAPKNPANGAVQPHFSRLFAAEMRPNAANLTQI